MNNMQGFAHIGRKIKVHRICAPFSINWSDVARYCSQKSGTATINGKDGADWTLKHESKLPDYYIEYKEAEKIGFKNFLGNLRIVAPDRMIPRGVYNNRNGHLPSKKVEFGMKQISIIKADFETVKE